MNWPYIKVKLLLVVGKVCILAYIECRTWKFWHRNSSICYVERVHTTTTMARHFHCLSKYYWVFLPSKCECILNTSLFLWLTNQFFGKLFALAEWPRAKPKFSGFRVGCRCLPTKFFSKIFQIFEKDFNFKKHFQF